MSDRTFIPLPSGFGTQLEAVRLQAEGDPGYFSDPSCPYPDELKLLLRRMTAPAGMEVSGEPGGVFVGGQDEVVAADAVLAEVEATINEMKLIERTLAGPGVEASDKVSFFKTKTALMEKWISIKERTRGVKQMSEFMRVVVKTMEELLDKDQILELKTRLKAANLGPGPGPEI